MPFRFEHETLHAYQKSLAVLHWLRDQTWPRGWAWLRDQTLRASGSVVLNIAEGRAHTGAVRRNHYRIAYGSAAEVSAALDILPLEGAEAQQETLRQVAVMLRSMAR